MPEPTPQSDETAQPVHGIDRYTQEHLCGERAGLGTDSIQPSMPITCPGCVKRLVRHRVTRTASALYSAPRTLRKRRRCDGHLSERHWIAAGQQAIWSSLPPDSEIGNEGWWHAVFCLDCAPADVVSPPGSGTPPPCGCSSPRPGAQVSADEPVRCLHCGSPVASPGQGTA